VARWRTLVTDEGAFDQEVVLDAADIEAMITWGTNPRLDPHPGTVPEPAGDASIARALATWTSSPASSSWAAA